MTRDDSGLGVAAASHPGTSSPLAAERGRLSYLLRLWRLMWEVDARTTVLLTIAETGVGLLVVASVHALRRLVETAQEVAAGQAPLGVGLAWGAIFALLQLVPSLVNLTVGVLRDGFQERLRAAIEERCYRQAQTMPLEALELPEHHDRLERARQGTEQRLLETMHFLWRNLADSVALVSLLLYLAQFHWGLPLLLAAGSTPGALLEYRLRRERYLLHRRQTEHQRRFAAYDRLLTGRETAAEIRLFGAGPWLIGRAMRLWERLQDERVRLGAREARRTTLFEVLNALAYLGAIVAGVGLLFVGRAGLGAYAALFTAVESFQFGYQRLLWDSFLLYEDLRYLRDFFDFVDGPRLQLDSGQPVPTGGANTTSGNGEREDNGNDGHTIVFDNVSFTYPGSSTPALIGISLAIRPGERIALVGENGAGKSTLVKLLMGLYTPTAGRITVDQVDVCTLALTDWYGRFGAVFQRFNRYQATVRENVGFGWLPALDDTASIEDAMRRSGADAVAAGLPFGIDTPLGREFWDGVELSTGQWQKLAIARAYVRPATLLVLDEPAAALDARAEADVYAHFARMATAATAVLISHRLGSCRIADRVFVLQEGRLVEHGTHAELLAADGVYAELYHAQAAWYR